MERSSSGAHEAFNGAMYGDASQYQNFDNLNYFADSNFNDASWGLNADNYQASLRASQPTQQQWSQDTSHLSASMPQQQQQQQHHHQQQQAYSGQASSYGRNQSHSPTPFTTNAFANYGNQQQYQHPDQRFDPALVQAPLNSAQNFSSSAYNVQDTSAPTIAPQALNHERPQQTYNPNGYPTQHQYQQPSKVPARQEPPVSNPTPLPIALRTVDEEALARAIPKGIEQGIFSVIDFDQLVATTNSERLAHFVNIGKERQEWNCTRSALPTYVARHSRRELRELAAQNSAALAKIGHKPSKVKPPRSRSFDPLAEIKRGALQAVAGTRAPGTDGAGLSAVKHEDNSASESESSASDDSDYSDDDDADTPLPAKKPEDPKGSVEYDTIKALWRSKRKEIGAESFRGALVDFWEIVKTIRDRWKIDSNALTEAEEKKRMGELPLLKSRVKDQRDMMEVAFRTALKHGHRGIVELLAENQSLIFVCFQFLLDRRKAEDLNGPVTRAILETMSTFTTLTDEKLEKTKLDKLFPVYLKKGDAKTQFWIKKIKANAALATKSAATKTPAGTSKTGALDKTTAAPAKPASPTAKRAEPVAGLKRAASNSSDSGPAKKVATGTAKGNGISSGAAKLASVIKKPTTGATAPQATTGAAPALRKTVPAKPSGFFSSLQSATKKPGTSIAERTTGSSAADKTLANRPAAAVNAPSAKPAFSFAETMAKLSKPKEEKPAPKVEKEVPSETADERSKRLRKETRRRLRVRFRPDNELVEIRLFTHHPEEELDHDASQMRDVSDVGGEGRMFKQQHQMMDLDDEDDAAEEPESLIEFRAPSLVDFSVVDKEERDRNYVPYGGGVHIPTSPESAEREKYEANTLVVFYPSPSDIPNDPREPTVPYFPEPGSEPHREFGRPEEKYIQRARERTAAGGSARAATGFNIAALAQFMNQQQAPPPMQQQQPTMMAAPAPASGAPDISAILASLRQASGSNAAPQSQAASPYFPAPVAAATVPPPQNPLGGLDLSAILASLNKNAGNAPAPPVGNGFAPMNFAHLSGSNATPIGNGGGSGGGAYDNDEDDDPEVKKNHPFYKTKVCRFWQEGRCQKGEACSYLHE